MCKAKEEAKATEEVKSTVVITKATLELKGVKKLRVEKIEKKIIVTNEIDPNTKVCANYTNRVIRLYFFNGLFNKINMTIMERINF